MKVGFAELSFPLSADPAFVDFGIEGSDRGRLSFVFSSIGSLTANIGNRIGNEWRLHLLEIFKIQPENYNVTSIFMRGEDTVQSRLRRAGLPLTGDKSDSPPLAAESFIFSGRKVGQYALLQVEFDGAWSDPHPFTLSNAPSDDHLQMTIKSLGAFTLKVPKIRPGTRAKCQGPYGRFCNGIEKYEDVTLVAGGIGITPFLSVLRHFRNTGASNRITLFWANNADRDVFCIDELHAVASVLNLQLVHVLLSCDDPPFPEGFKHPNCHFERGYLTQKIIQKYSQIQKSRIFICGPPAMHDFIMNELRDLPIDLSKVQREKFVAPMRNNPFHAA